MLRRLAIAKEFMDESFLKNPAVAEIAKTAMLSEYHFFRSFKMAYRESPYQYMLNKRLQYAKDLLVHTEMPIYKIASLVNFGHQFAFTKAFKQKYKIPPQAIQKSSKLSRAPGIIHVIGS